MIWLYYGDILDQSVASFCIVLKCIFIQSTCCAVLIAHVWGKNYQMHSLLYLEYYGNSDQSMAFLLP